MKKAIIGLVIVALIGVGAFLVLKDKDSDTSEDQTQNVASTQATPEPEAEISTKPVKQSAKNVITFGSSGFSPASITVSVGDTVTVKNNSTSDVQFSSDDHPTHTINEELNQDSLAPGASQSFAVTTKGTFGYHNHLNSSQIGMIVVE